MKSHLLQSAFTAASHIPHITEYLHGLRFQFRENGFDVTSKAHVTRHVIGVTAKLKF